MITPRLSFRSSVVVFIALAAFPGSLAGQSTIDHIDKFAYAANAGWINFRPSSPDGVIVGEAFLSGFAYAANSGWINLGDGLPPGGIQYANTSATNFGVNHDGMGNLSGYAYGANIGWVNYGWASVHNPNRPRIDLLTGIFHGYAYGANVGWINLGAGHLATVTISFPDTDSDGIGDPWEMTHFSNLTTATEATDSDGDGESDVDEYYADTDPLDPFKKLRISSSSFNLSVPKVTLKFSSSPTRVYRIEFKNDLKAVEWTNSSLGTFAPDPGATTTRTVSYPSNDTKFFRIVAEKPLAPP